MFAYRFWEPPRGKHCNSLEGNVGRKVVPTFKNRFLREIIAFSPLFYRKCCFKGSISFCLNNHKICSKLYRLTCLYAQSLLWTLHCAVISKFRETNYKSPRNNLKKPFQFFGRVLSLLLAFFFVILKSTTTATSRHQEIETVCLSIKYYRGTLRWNTYTASLLLALIIGLKLNPDDE